MKPLLDIHETKEKNKAIAREVRRLVFQTKQKIVSPEKNCNSQVAILICIALVKGQKSGRLFIAKHSLLDSITTVANSLYF